MKARLFSSIELLEDRIAPAGLVKITYAGGHLTLDGDTADNALSVVFTDASTVVLRGLGGTSLVVNGKTETGPVTLADFTGDLTASLGDGNDSLQLGPGAFKGNVTLDLGNGENSVTTGQISVAGNLSITGGSGADHVTFGGSRTAVGGNVTLDLGDGTNSIASGVGAFMVDGNLSVKTGSGNDSLVFGGSEYSIGGDTSISSGAGSDTVGFFATKVGVFGGKLTVSGAAAAGQGESFTFSGDEQVVFRGAIAIHLGAGDGNVALYSGGKLQAHGDVSIDTGKGADHASVTGAEVALGGDVTVKSSGGVDVKVAATKDLQVAGDVTVKGGSGTDNVTISGGGEIAGAVSVDVGTGDNQTITIAGTATKSLVLKNAVSLLQGAADGKSTTTLLNADFLASLVFTSSTAADTVKIAGVTFGGMTDFSTGGGDDIMDVDSHTLTFLNLPLKTIAPLLDPSHGIAAIIAGASEDRLQLSGGSVLDTAASLDLTSSSLTEDLYRRAQTTLSAEAAR